MGSALARHVTMDASECGARRAAGAARSRARAGARARRVRRVADRGGSRPRDRCRYFDSQLREGRLQFPIVSVAVERHAEPPRSRGLRGRRSPGQGSAWQRTLPAHADSSRRDRRVPPWPSPRLSRSQNPTSVIRRRRQRACGESLASRRWPAGDAQSLRASAVEAFCATSRPGLTGLIARCRARLGFVRQPQRRALTPNLLSGSEARRKWWPAAQPMSRARKASAA